MPRRAAPAERYLPLSPLSRTQLLVHRVHERRDTDACERKALETDWRRALDCGLGRYILKQDDFEDESESECRWSMACGIRASRVHSPANALQWRTSLSPRGVELTIFGRRV